jgi:hypothetical protein
MSITLYGSTVGVGNVTTVGVPEGNSNRLAYDGGEQIEYGVNGGVLIRGGAHSNPIFNFNHIFDKDSVKTLKAMAFLSLQRQHKRITPFHVFLEDKRCKVPDTNPPTYAYSAGSLEVIGNGAATQAHRIYKVLFSNGPPTVGKTYTNGSEELIFEMKAIPYFASEQLPAPPLTLISVGSVPENANTSTNTYLLAEFS